MKCSVSSHRTRLRSLKWCRLFTLRRSEKSVKTLALILQNWIACRLSYLTHRWVNGEHKSPDWNKSACKSVTRYQHLVCWHTSMECSRVSRRNFWKRSISRPNHCLPSCKSRKMRALTSKRSHWLPQICPCRQMIKLVRIEEKLSASIIWKRPVVSDSIRRVTCKMAILASSWVRRRRS